MRNNWYKKSLVVGIIVLFVSVSITSSTGKINRAVCENTIYDGSLLGYVNDTSGNPIEGALVRVYFHETYEEDYSDSTGYYHVTDIPICECLKNATCSKEDYKTEWILLGIAENTTHDFILTSINNNLPLPPIMWTEDFSTFYIPTPQNPDGDDVYYWIDWGDGTSSEWIGPYAPGETACVSHEWIDEGTYEIKVKAKDQDGESRWAVYSLTLSSDFKFFGIKIGYVDMTYTFTIYWKDGCDCLIMIDWGDGEPTEWFGPFEQPLLFSHEWSEPGVYELRMKMKDIYGNESDWITYMITILSLENNPPSKPYMSGKWIIFRVELECYLRAIDPDGDDVEYYINWGDGTSDITDFYKSNETVTVIHTYSAQGCYTVRAYAEDIYGARGPENTLPVRSKNKAVNFNLLFLRLLERLPLLNLLLQRLRI
jgi:hypothetical protein